MKKYCISACLVFLTITGYSQKSNKDYSEAFKLIEVWLDAQKDFEQLPGITAIAVEDQKVLWTGAFGMANIEDKVKAEASTLCSICSISKLFTSVAIMKLYDEGKLRLDDLVSDVLPWYNLEQQFPESGPITIRTLLTHSSGLPREAAYPYWTEPDFTFPTQEQVKSKLGEQETIYPSSTYFQYSNLGLTLLGEIVEEVSGIPFEDYVYKSILEPLGLSDTRTELPESLYGNSLAIGYGALTREHKRERINFFQANGISPAAGFSSNVQNLGIFASWQFRLVDSTITEILKPSTLKNMQRVHWTDPDWKTTWGLGFKVYKGSDNITWVGHNGSCPGYKSSLLLNIKDKRAYSVMINANGTNPAKYVYGMNKILSKVKEPDKINVSQKKDLQEYVGYFTDQPWEAEIYIGTWENKLVSFSLPSNSPWESLTFFKQIEGDTFQRVREDKELGELLIFERDEDGQIIRFKRHDNYAKRVVR